LSQYVEGIFLPVYLTGSAPRYVKGMRQTAALFIRICGDLPLDQISTPVLARFKAALRAEEERFPSCPRQLSLPGFGTETTERHWRGARNEHTANKHLRQLAQMLAKLGPADCGRNADALELLAKVPRVKPYRAPRPRPPDIAPELLGTIYAACWAADYPGEDPPAWWQALLTCAFCEAFRRGGLIHAAWIRGDGLRWDGIDWERRTIRLKASADKCHQEREKPLHEVAVKHLLRIRTADEYVFPFPHSESTFYRQWHRIQLAAKLPRRLHIHLHAVKSASLSAYATEESPWIAQFMGDHASIATGQHYVNVSRAARAAVDRLAIPDAFRGPAAG